MLKKQEKSVSLFKVVFMTVGIVLMILAALAVAYKFFKKHFKVTFESGDCSFGDDDCFCDEPDYDPEYSECDCAWDECDCGKDVDTPSEDADA